MRKIAICKYGQKVCFDRKDKLVDRSNVNGNQDVYKTFELLFECNPNDVFYIVSENVGAEKYDNAIDCSGETLEELASKSIDYLVVMGGVKEYEKDERLIRIINELPVKKSLLLVEDPRLIYSMSEDNRLNVMFDEVVGQTKNIYVLNNTIYDMKYVPIQTAICYKNHEFKDCKKVNNKLLIIANSSSSKYSRPKVVSSLCKGLNFEYELYGRLTADEQNLFDAKAYKGEVKYEQIVQKQSESICSLVVPVEKEWCTSKYVELLANGCLPIFYKDYGVHYLDCELVKKYTVCNTKELNEVLNFVYSNFEEVKNDVKAMYEDLVAPYIDGMIINNQIIKRLVV